MNWNLTLPLLVAINLFLPLNPAFASDRKEQEAQAIERVLERLGEGTPQQILARLMSNKASTAWLQERPANYVSLIPRHLRERLLMGGSEVEKLHRLAAPIFTLHQQTGVIEPLVFRDDQIYVALVGGWHIAVSTRALLRLAEEELQAAVAHEVGHLYTMVEAYYAEKAKDHAKLRETELFADAVSALTMKALSKDPAAVLRGIEKELSRLAAQGTVALTCASHPTTESRKVLNARLTRILADN
jgi:Zn-dependent protease with chaperone function